MLINVTTRRTLGPSGWASVSQSVLMKRKCLQKSLESTLENLSVFRFVIGFECVENGGADEEVSESANDQ